MVSARRALIAGILVCPPAGSPGQVDPRFADRSATSQVDLVTFSGSEEKPHILESTGNGVLTLDYDGDGYQDLYFVASFRLPREPDSPAEHSALYRNNGDGTFHEVTDRAGVVARVYGQGGCIGDYYGDGLPDIYLTVLGPNILYRNNGDGTFTEVSAEAGVADPRWSIGATFFDADGDGDQDLFVGNYIEASWEEVQAARRTRLWRGKVAVMDGPRGLPEGANTYYRNNGDGTFSEATEVSGLTVGGMGYTMGVTSFDYDDDGDTDLYLANDSTPNRLYRNRGDGVFDEVGMSAGGAYNADGRMQGSMGVDFGDFDGDGRLDLVVTNFAHDHYALYRNLGGGLFADDSFVSQVAMASFAPLGWAALLFDPDSDGDLDLFFANGHIYPQVDADPSLNESYRQLNQLLLNDGGIFREITSEAGEAFSILESSRGAVAVDLENDGDLDVVVSNQDARPSLLENVSRSNQHWALFDLSSPRGARQALGVRAELATGGQRQIREVTSGGGYASEDDPRVHFGIGHSSFIDEALIRWPAVRRVVFEGLPADRFYVVRPEGH